MLGFGPLFVVNRKGKIKIQMKKKPDSPKIEKEMKIVLTQKRQT